MRGNDYTSIYFNVNSGKKVQFDVIQCGEYKCRISKSMDNHLLENTSVSEDPILNDTKKNTYNCSHSDNNNVDHLVSVRDIHNLNMYDTFLVLDRGNKKDGISYILILKIKFLKSTIIILF